MALDNSMRLVAVAEDEEDDGDDDSDFFLSLALFFFLCSACPERRAFYDICCVCTPKVKRYRNAVTGHWSSMT